LSFLFCFSMYIPAEAFRQHFDPRTYLRETYLLCELQWGGSAKLWRHWVRNYSYDNNDNDDGDDDNRCHAEKYFLEEVFEPRSYKVCNMTWYLSWSPCYKCCDIIQNFLEEHHNVNIDIYVARLHCINDARNCRALRELASLEGVNYLASVSPDYRYCWETFIQEDVYYNFSPANFRSAIERNRLKLDNILTVSTL
ncbi:ABEC1 enzyme, partial [Promerops cafer]|nr:ABEC1 enzyme [Promerops cafer]